MGSTKGSLEAVRHQAVVPQPQHGCEPPADPLCSHRMKKQQMTTARPRLDYLCRFQVRDLSEHYDSPTFDIIFHDRENGVERYSEAIWTSPEQATIEAKRLDEAQLRPVHWDVIGR